MSIKTPELRRWCTAVLHLCSVQYERGDGEVLNVVECTMTVGHRHKTESGEWEIGQG